MNLFVKILLGFLAVLALAAVYVLNPRLPTPDGEQSASLYQPGLLGVARERQNRYLTTGLPAENPGATILVSVP